jgi:EAL domain-containing protein (putative c-di-GMP-specific phosphodiesterase class I)
VQILQGAGDGSILLPVRRQIAASGQDPTVNNPEADYYRLRTEWLRYKSHLYDSLTSLPALAAVVEDVRKLLESQRGVEVLYLDLGRSGWHETELGWATYDGLVREFAGALRRFRELGLLGTQDIVCLNTVRCDRFLVFLAGGERGFSAQARRERLLLGLRDALKRPDLGSLRSLRIAAGHARIAEHPMSRAERAIQQAVAEAMIMSLMEREGADAARHEALATLIAGSKVRSVFHPIVRLADARVVGHEALTRVDFHGAFESIEELFSFAETTELVVDFERVCRRTAIRSSARLPRGGHLFLNASARAVADPDWLDGETPELLAGAGLRPDEVVVEVTERLAVSHHDGFEPGLRALKERGYRVAIDDMGAGYASLQALAAIEPDFLKFDTRLVRDIDRSSIKRSLLESLRVLAEKIHARVIAEGIERDEERETLTRLGIEFGQGFLFNNHEEK